MSLKERFLTALCRGESTVLLGKNEPRKLFLPTKHRARICLGALKQTEAFAPYFASTHSPWFCQPRTRCWIQRRPRCEQHQSWHKPAWLPLTRGTQTYRWPPCPLSGSHISSGCWQGGKSDPEVPCGTEGMLSRDCTTWLTQGEQRKDELGQEWGFMITSASHLISWVQGISKKGGLGHAGSQAASAIVGRRKKGRVVLATEGEGRELQVLSRAARL